MKKGKPSLLEIHNAEKRISAFKTSKKSCFVQLLICGIIIYILCSYGVVPFTYGNGEDGDYLDTLTLFIWLMPMVGIYNALESLFFPSRARKFEEEFRKDFLEELKKKR